jgi:hypothetical protein
MNFRHENEHDQRFMTLVRSLNGINRLDVLEKCLNLPKLGELQKVQRRKAFDVEVVFSERRLLVETKVDSDEGGRWDAVDDSAAWQTNQIVAKAQELWRDKETLTVGGALPADKRALYLEINEDFPLLPCVHVV